MRVKEKRGIEFQKRNEKKTERTQFKNMDKQKKGGMEISKK